MGKFPHKWNFLVTIFELGFWTCSLIFILPPYNYFLVLQYYSKTNFNWLCNNPTFSKSGWIFDCDNFAVVSSRGWLHIRCTPGKSKCICSLSFSIKKWKLNFVYSYKGTRYPWRADSVLDRAQNHSLRAASGSRAHLSRPAWNKGQFKIAFFLHAQKAQSISFWSLAYPTSLFSHGSTMYQQELEATMDGWSSQESMSHSKISRKKYLVGNYIHAKVCTALHIKYSESICKYIYAVKNYSPWSGQTDSEVISINYSKENIKK